MGPKLVFERLENKLWVYTEEQRHVGGVLWGVGTVGRAWPQGSAAENPPKFK
jgi:hypothetical protein